MSTTSPQASAATALSSLIGLIYDTATDIALWPQLLEGMDSYLHASGLALPALVIEKSGISENHWRSDLSVASSANEQGSAEQELLANLAPHFMRADEIHRQLVTAEEERNLLESIMDRLPLGMAIVNEYGDLISMNRAFVALTQSSELLRVMGGRLTTMPTDVLTPAIQRAMSDKPIDAALRLGDIDQGGSISIWISRAPIASSTTVSNRRVMILAASQSSRALSDRGLAELFDLSPAEARITQHLALGRTIEEAAVAQGVSTNTAKTHLKKVFSKFGVRRQAELIRAVYSSPLWLDLSSQAPQPVNNLLAASPTKHGADSDNHRLKLADGRWLSYSDNGDESGTPVVLMHGVCGSRHLRHPDDALLMENKLRLIIPERPGSGDSTPCPNRQIKDWAADVHALADHLQLESFMVLGYSAGTPYAFAVAAALPERVKQVVIVAAMPPLETLEDIRSFTPTFRMSLLVARLTPSLLPPMLRVVAKGIERNVYRYIENSMEGATESDRHIFSHPRFRASYAIGLLAGVKRGEEDMVKEIALIAGDWSIPLRKLTQPVVFWHGSDDHLVGIEGAQRFARRLPGSHFITIPKAGHFVLHSHWSEIANQIARANINAAQSETANAAAESITG